MSNCHCNSDIVRDGSGQLGRYLHALDPSFAPIDDRSIEDMLVFAKRYANQIRFYDVPGSKIEGDDPKEPITWREFFRRDIAVIGASIATIDLVQIKKDYDETSTHLAQHTTGEVYASLYTIILGMAARIDNWHASSLPGYPLRKDLDLGIASSLKPALQKVVAYEKGYSLVDIKPLALDYSAIKNIALWGLDETIPADPSIYVGATTEEKILHASLFTEEVFLAFYGFLQKLVDNSDEYLEYALEQYPAHQPHMALFIAFLEIFRLAQDQMNGLTGRMLDFYYRGVLHLAERPSVPDKVHLVFELAKDVTEYDLEKNTALLAGKDASGKDQVYITDTDFVINSAKVKELKTLFIQKKPGVAITDPKIITAFYAKPVANSSDGNGAKFTVANPKWPTLGIGYPVISDPQNICEAISAVKEIGNTPAMTQVGFAIASPQLLLQGGRRLLKIAFTGLATLAKYATAAQPVFDIYLTGEKSWLQVSSVLADVPSQDLLIKALTDGVFDDKELSTPVYFIRADAVGTALYIYLPITAEPVLPFDSKLHSGNLYNTASPVMQILLRDGVEISETDYSSVRMDALSIEVKVGSINDRKKKQSGIRLDGLKTLILQNDAGIVDATKPFDPFTGYPSPGRSLYIGSAEVFNKSLGELAIDVRKTKDALTGNESGDDNFDYKVNVLNHRVWTSLADASASQVFTREGLTQNVLFTVQKASDNDDMAVPLSLNRKPIAEVTQWNGKQEKGFLRIDYINDFNNEFNFQDSRNLAPALEVKEISLSYHSTLFRLEAGVDQLFHVYPFGIAEVSLVVRDPKHQLTGTVANRISFAAANPNLVNAYNHLLPQFTYTSFFDRYKVPDNTIVTKNVDGLKAINSSLPPTTVEELSKRFPKRADQLILEASGLREEENGKLNQYSANLQEEGLLFIGLEKAKPLQTISLLFQFADGSALDEDSDPPQIHWTYLVNNEWRTLRSEHIISDGTYGFQTTGIIRLEIPDDATSNHSIITDGLYWLSASVSEYSDRIPQLVDVVAQAVLASFEDNGNASSHFDNALPAGSIVKLAVANASVSKVLQPFASFDGKHREIGKEFYTHVSERLRHKGRAVNSWDYEHLVLDRFPSIYKVKCIQHTDPNCLCRHPEVLSTRVNQIDGNKAGANGNDVITCCGPQLAPGHVLIVPIANLKNRNASDPLQPKTSRRTLLEIQDYLSKRTSPFVHVHARNPVYEQVMVFFRVQFYTGTDKGFFLKKLNDEIVEFLTPWAFSDTADVVFGQKVYASAIINFIEERPYVDFITDFVMDVCLHQCCPPSKGTNGNDGEDDPNPFAKIHDCDDMEALISSADFVGYDVATPSTARSILVSAPQHIIVPYEAPDRLTPCQQRKVTREVGVDSGPFVNPPPPPIPVTDPIIPPTPPNKPIVGQRNENQLESIVPKKVARKAPKKSGK